MALELLSVVEAAERLRVSPYTIRHWARQRRFTWFKLGTRMVIDLKDLERYVTEQKRVPVGVGSENLGPQDAGNGHAA